MTYIITENCIKCKYTDCVEVCPVDCFHEGPNFLVINPDECIDCSLCEPECPIDAIISDENVTDDNRKFLEINERLSKKWPIITEFKDHMTCYKFEISHWRKSQEQKKILYKICSVV